MKVEITIEADNIKQVHTSLAHIKKALRKKRKQSKLRRRDAFKPFLLVSTIGNWALGVDIE